MEEGGLGIKDIRMFNSAILAKWKWRLLSNEQGKWKDILVSKYSMESGRRPSQEKPQSWWWRDLSKICGEGVEEGWFQSVVQWKAGFGDKVKFWEDAWLGRNKLINLYPRLFSLSLDQGRTMGEVGVWEWSVWYWRLRWKRERFD